MKVNRVMTAGPATCTANESLNAAAAVMWHRDCGAVPIVDDQHHVVGMITDRDICIALASRNARGRGVRIGDVMSINPISCRSDGDIADVLSLMAEHRLHRLPVADAEGILCGIVTLSDLIHLTGKPVRKADRISRKEMLHAIRTITAPRSGAEPAKEITNHPDPIRPQADQVS